MIRTGVVGIDEGKRAEKGESRWRASVTIGYMGRDGNGNHLILIETQ